MRLFILKIKKPSFELSFLLTFQTTGLSLKEKIYIKLCYSLKVFLIDLPATKIKTRIFRIEAFRNKVLQEKTS